MSIKSDRWIRQQAQEHGMIEPFSEKQVRDGVISYGLSSYGYDLRVSDEFKIFTNVNSAIIDPKAFDERSFVTVVAESVIVPPNSFALARSIEYFKIPRDVLTICVGKSTYARCGIIVNVTPFEPEWEGFVTLEISNTTPLPARIYANEGLCQILFFQSDEVCETSYAGPEGQVSKATRDRLTEAVSSSHTRANSLDLPSTGPRRAVYEAVKSMEPNTEQPTRRIGLILRDPLRLLGLQGILLDESNLTTTALSIPGALHSFELKLLILDTGSAPELTETLQIFRRQRPDMRVIVLGPPADLEFVQMVIGAGAKGYLSHDARESEIKQCVDVVCDGSIWAPRKVLARLLDAGTASAAQNESKFTDREGQVLNLLIEGRPNRDIALSLGIDEGTVKAHVSRLMRKVGVGNRTALTMHILSAQRTQ